MIEMLLNLQELHDIISLSGDFPVLLSRNIWLPDPQVIKQTHIADVTEAATCAHRSALVLVLTSLLLG